MAKIQGKDVLQGVKLPAKRNKRAVETKKRVMAEKAFEQDVFDWLWLHSGVGVGSFLKYGKVESNPTYNSRYAFHGFSDIMVFNLRSKTIWFVELKVEGRGLRTSQLFFRSCCDTVGGNVKYLVVRELRELEQIL